MTLSAIRNALKASTVVPAALVASSIAIVAVASYGQHPTAATDAVLTASSTSQPAASDATIPATALRAYQEAASTVTVTNGCELDWTLLAGLGSVESDHGRIADPNGPFHFTAKAWDVYGTDGDGDDVRDVQDIDDAAAAAAVFLCATGKNLSNTDGQRAALALFVRNGAVVDEAMAAAGRYGQALLQPAPRFTTQQVAAKASGSAGTTASVADTCHAALTAAGAADVDSLVALCAATFAGQSPAQVRAGVAQLVAGTAL